MNFLRSGSALVLSLIMIALFIGCSEDALVERSDSDNIQGHETVLSVFIGKPDNVIFRSSTGDAHERTIKIAYLLIFRNGKYFEGEKIPLKRITQSDDNGIAKIRTPLKLNEGDELFIVLNSYGAKLSKIKKGDDQSVINDVFPGKVGINWILDPSNSKFCLPMRGHAPNWKRTETIDVQRAVAKISFSLDKLTLDKDKSRSLYGNDNVWIKLTNIPDEGLFNGGIPKSAKIVSSDYIKINRSFYFPLADNLATSNDFKKERPCVTIRYGVRARDKNNKWVNVYDSQNKQKLHYYRLDFADNNRYLNREIKQNTNYKFTITQIGSHGYQTLDEAYENPPANLFYDFEQINSSNDYSIYSSTESSGQYAVTTEVENFYIFYINKNAKSYVYDAIPWAEKTIDLGKIYTNAYDGKLPATNKISVYKIPPNREDVHQFSEYDKDKLLPEDEMNGGNYDHFEIVSPADKKMKIGATELSIKIRPKTSTESFIVFDFGNVRKIVCLKIYRLAAEYNNTGTKNLEFDGISEPIIVSDNFPEELDLSYEKKGEGGDHFYELKLNSEPNVTTTASFWLQYDPKNDVNDPSNYDHYFQNQEVKGLFRAGRSCIIFYYDAN